MRTYSTAQGTLLSALGTKMRRKSKQEGIRVYIELIHFFVQQKLTQSCKATIPQ